VKITHHFGAGTYIKQIELEAGECVGKHTHTFDHLSILVSGMVHLKAGGITRILEGHHVLAITANVAHEVTAIKPSVWLCTHATDCVDAAEIDNVLTRAES